MPFTPFHMGPGIAIKAMLQGSFSLMVFGWAQIVMDLQPLFVMITGEGHLTGSVIRMPVQPCWRYSRLLQASIFLRLVCFSSVSTGNGRSK